MGKKKHCTSCGSLVRGHVGPHGKKCRNAVSGGDHVDRQNEDAPELSNVSDEQLMQEWGKAEHECSALRQVHLLNNFPVIFESAHEQSSSQACNVPETDPAQNPHQGIRRNWSGGTPSCITGQPMQVPSHTADPGPSGVVSNSFREEMEDLRREMALLRTGMAELQSSATRQVPASNF